MLGPPLPLWRDLGNADRYMHVVMARGSFMHDGVAVGE